MPSRTKTYNLTAFSRGDIYSASLDRERMRIIDNELFFISNVVGDGVINGWSVVGDSSGSYFGGIDNGDSYTITITEGQGIIDDTYSRTYGDLSVDIPKNGIYYIHMQRKFEYIHSFSGFSSPVLLVGENTSSPSVPINFAITLLYNKVNLNWDRNTEADISHYIIERSLDGVDFVVLDSNVTNNYYVDNSVSENTTYYYRIKSVDLSGNQSSYTAIESGLTPFDLTEPPNPISIKTLTGDGYFQLVWDKTKLDSSISYMLEVYLLDNENTIVSLVGNYSTSDNNFIVDNISNNSKYKVVLKSISANNIESSGVDFIFLPVSDLGPEKLSSLSISESKSVKNENGIVLNISGDIGINEYKDLPVKYIITLIENGNITSDTIEVHPESDEAFFTTSFEYSLETYKVSSLVKNIKPYTSYLVKVQGVNELGLKDKGVFGFIKTSSFVKPNSPTKLNASIQKDNSLLYTWINPKNNFDSNIISVYRINSNDNSSVKIVDSENIGKRRFYSIDRPLVSNSVYKIEIQSLGNNSLCSDIATFSYTFSSIDDINLSIPADQFCFNGDGCVFLSWRDVYPNISKYFKIWRSSKTQPIAASDFTLIDTIPSDNTSYVDYSVDNNSHYTYFVTIEDIYGRESGNPNTGNFSHPLVRAYPNADETFLPVRNVNVIQSGYNAIITWDIDNDSFDGWEIYRSDSNLYSWEKVDSIDKNINMFIDENAILENGKKYYYMVRKYRNECNAIVASADTYINSLLLATIDTRNNTLSISSNVNNLFGLESKITLDTISEINNHKHLNYTNSDNRIDLSSSVTINGWTTEDNQVFQTSQSIPNANRYIVYIDNVRSQIFYDIDVLNKKIIFSQPVSYSDIYMKAVDVTEVDNTLYEGNIQKLSANSVSYGEINPKSFRNSHDSRLRERALPLMVRAYSDDGYSYYVNENIYQITDDYIGDAFTLYDIIHISSGNYVGVSSNGLVYTDDSGSSWSKLGDFDGVFHKLYYSSGLNKYFALANKYVYISEDGTSWYKASGLRNINAIRDISEDSNNYMYITTNIGVFVLDDSSLGQLNVFKKLNSISSITNNCFGIWVNSFDDTIFVSTDKGVYESNTGGLTWSYSLTYDLNCIIYDFFESSGYVFAVGEDNIFRKEKNYGNFINIVNNSFGESRRIIVYNDRILISSAKGVYISEESYDIYSDIEIDIDNSITEVNGQRKYNPIYCLSVTNAKVFASSDSDIYSGSDLNNLSNIYSESGTISPSVYVGGNLIYLGYYYNINNKKVFLDTKVKENVYIANQYKIYKSSNSGWIGQRYSSSITVYVNNSKIIDYNNGALVSNVISSLASVTFDHVTSSNSDYDQALEDIVSYNSELSRLQAVFNNDQSLNINENLYDIVNNVVNLYDKVNSNIYNEYKYYTNITVNSESYYIIDNEILSDISLYDEYMLIPDIEEVELIFTNIYNSDNVVDYINIVDGVIAFQEHNNKHDLVLIDIPNSSISGTVNNTHFDLEDNLEIYNSGLNYKLSEVYQSLLVQTGMFLEKTFPGEQFAENCGIETFGPYNVKYYILEDDLTIYNSTQSTVDWILEDHEYTCDLNTVFYVNDVVYLSGVNKVYVATDHGLISIETTSPYIRSFEDIYKNSIYYNKDIEDQKINKLKVIDNIMYIITDLSIIYTSDGQSYSRMITNGLDGNILDFMKFNNYYIAITDSGLYAMDIDEDVWKLYDSNITLPNALISDNKAFVVSDEVLFTSLSGISWEINSDFSDTIINDIKRFLGQFYLATNNGLRIDNSSFYSNNASSSLVDILSNPSDSEASVINDLEVKSDELVAFSSNGKYYKSSNGNSWTEYDSLLDTIHKGLYVDGDLWMFGYNMLRIESESLPFNFNLGETV